ncbi:solute carrier family 22 member 6 isoform X4 [Panthera onca]
MAFNDLLQQVGGVGRFQQIQVTLVVLPLLLMASHNTLQNFTAAIPTHHCRPPAEANFSQDGGLEAWLPRDGQGQPESCLRFTVPRRGPPFPNSTDANSTGATEPCTNGWIYDNSTFPSTIVTEWDLVCSNRALRQLAQSLYMVGVLLGAMVFGYLADRLGRRKVLILNYLQTAVSGTCAAFAPNFPVYCAFRLLSGMSLASVALNCMTLSLEWMPIHTRACVGTLIGYVYSLGQFLLAGVAYAVPHWRPLQLLVSVPFFAFFIYSWFFIESARWHSSSGRLDLTLKTLQRVAWINGKREEGTKLSMEYRNTSSGVVTPRVHRIIPQRQRPIWLTKHLETFLAQQCLPETQTWAIRCLKLVSKSTTLAKADTSQKCSFPVATFPITPPMCYLPDAANSNPMIVRSTLHISIDEFSGSNLGFTPSCRSYPITQASFHGLLTS